jgi:hypothetical protein
LSLCAACGVGGLDNRPLGTGAVTGIATECDSGGVIGLVGDSEVRDVPNAADGSCTFRVEGLLPGTHQLYVAPTGKKVALVSAEVQATLLTDVGDVVGLPGAFAKVRVSAPMGTDVSGMVLAPDLPIVSTAVGRSGMARIGPFPEGCFLVEVSLTGVGKKSVTSCMTAGEEQSLDVAF